jgi:hypothetical protein
VTWCLNGAFVNLSEMLTATSINIVSRCITGQKFEEEEDGKSRFGHLSRRVMVLLGAFCFGDFFFLFWDGLMFLWDLSRALKSLSEN